LEFKSLEESINTKKIPFDNNMVMHDFLKIENSKALHAVFCALDKFREKNSGKYPTPWDMKDFESMLALSQEEAKKIEGYNYEEDKNFESIVMKFSFTC